MATNTIEAATEALKPVSIMPDGPQGGRVTLGISSDEQLLQLRTEIEEKGAKLSIKAVRAAAKKLNIPVVDS